MLHLALLLPSAYKGRDRRLSRFCQTVGFDQEQLAFSQSEKWLAALKVGAVAQHITNSFRARGLTLGEHLGFLFRCTLLAISLLVAIKRSSLHHGFEVAIGGHHLCRNVGISAGLPAVD